MRKIIVIIASIIVSMSSFFIVGQKTKIFESLGMFPLSTKDLEKIYYTNEDELISIGEFVWSNQYTSIRIDLYDSAKIMECYNEEKRDKEIIEISDEKLISNLETLKNNDFIRIVKESNYVLFQTWGSLGGSISLLYSPDEKPRVLDNAIEIVVEKIKPKGWYYNEIIYE